METMHRLKSLAKRNLRAMIGPIDRPSDLFGLAYWYQENLWEPPVQYALQDLCRPGAVVFDIGANFGGLSVLMSRAVGPRGVVCSFEASPRIVDKCQQNLIHNGCANTQLFHAAVYQRSNEKVSIYLGSHLNDSIYAANGSASEYRVSTIAIDDFVEHTGLVPEVMKLDIEGAEFDAILGAQRTIEKAHPHLILETQPEDTRCLDLLRSLGYQAIDLNTYREVTSPTDYPAGVKIRNVLYIHKDRLSSTVYCLPLSTERVAVISGRDFVKAENGSIHSREKIKLPRGRYLIDLDATAKGLNNDLMCGIRVDGAVAMRLHGYSALLMESYRDWVIDMVDPGEMSIYFEFQGNTSDETLLVEQATVRRIVNSESWPRPLFR